MGENAIYAVAFWGVNTMLNQNIVWISGRPYSIGLFLTLVALNCWQYPEVFMPFYGLAMITNISIVFAPVLLFFLQPESWQAKSYLAFMVLAGFPWIIWKFNKRFTKGLIIDRDNFAFKKRKFNTFAKIVLYYVWTIFVPVRMGWYHQAGFRYNERWEKFNYLTLIGYALIGFLIYCGLPGWIFLLGILPCSNLYATNSFLVDRYLYLPSIGIAMIVAPYLSQYTALFYIAMTFYITKSYMYSRTMKNDESLYRENMRNHPKSDYAINNLVYFLIQQHRYDEARIYAQRGLDINPANKMLWYNMGITYAAQGHFKNDEGKMKFIHAFNAMKKALAIEPRWAKPANDIRKIVKLLLDNKVLTMNPKEAIGPEIPIPNLIGMKEIINGTIVSTAPNGKQITHIEPAQAGSTEGNTAQVAGETATNFTQEPSVEVS